MFSLGLSKAPASCCLHNRYLRYDCGMMKMSQCFLKWATVSQYGCVLQSGPPYQDSCLDMSFSGSQNYLFCPPFFSFPSLSLPFFSSLIFLFLPFISSSLLPIPSFCLSPSSFPFSLHTDLCIYLSEHVWGPSWSPWSDANSLKSLPVWPPLDLRSGVDIVRTVESLPEVGKCS